MNAMAYKGYEAIVDYDADAELFHGEVVNTRDVITFQGRSVEELKAALADLVEDYLAFCRERGEDPEKPYSGQFVVRVDPALHRAVAAAAKRAGASSQQMGRRRAGASDGALSVARPVRRRRPVKSNALRHGLAFACASLTGHAKASGRACPMLAKKAEAVSLPQVELDHGRKDDADAHEIDDDENRDDQPHDLAVLGSARQRA